MTPVDRIRCLLHHEPREALLQRAHEVAARRAFEGSSWVCRIGVGVVGGEVEPLRPLPVVAGLEEAHEVGRDRNARRNAFENGSFHLEELEQRVGTEAVPVELL
jgi:hypothetical protein